MADANPRLGEPHGTVLPHGWAQLSPSLWSWLDVRRMRSEAPHREVGVSLSLEVSKTSGDVALRDVV